jgi:hypothetical protein
MGNAMFNKRTILLEFAVGMAAATLTLGGTGVASAQPAPREYIAATDTYSVMTENDQAVLVLGVLKPGNRTPFISAPARLNYWLTDCEYRTVARSGETADWKMRQGNAGRSTAIEAISRENIGKSDCRVISFEPKDPSASTAATQFPQEAPRCFVASPDICSVIAQNDTFILVEAVLKPGQQTQFFSAPPALFFYLTDCTTRGVYKGGAGLDFPMRPSGLAFSIPLREYVALKNTGTSECRILMFTPK